MDEDGRVDDRVPDSGGEGWKRDARLPRASEMVGRAMRFSWLTDCWTADDRRVQARGRRVDSRETPQPNPSAKDGPAPVDARARRPARERSWRMAAGNVRLPLRAAFPAG